MSSTTPIIYYASVDANIATVLVATLNEQIYSISLGDSEQAPLQELYDYAQAHFNEVQFIKADKDNQLLNEATELLQKYLNTPNLAAYQKMQQLPLYVEGTEFQKKIWTELKMIPVGQTATYAKIARQIGAPKAVRAVANACANNRHGIIVPCHRVLRSDGGISGYRWGIERKKQILALEAKAI
jgi:AraC family transcriptional regulator of adaptative response/methylated-DNA-[protein]-cysteine methyltransferase